MASWLKLTSSLRLKYAALAAFVVAFVIVVQYTIAAPLQLKKERDSIMAQARSSATLSAGLLVNAYSANKNEVGFQLSKAMRQVFDQIPMFDQFVVVSNQGQLLYDSQVLKNTGTAINLKDSDTVKLLQANQINEQSTDTTTYLYTPYFDAQGNHIDTIRYTVNLDVLKSFHEQALTQFIIALVVFVPLTFVLFWFVTSRLVIKAIEQIHSDINLIASGETDHRIHLNRRDEFGNLADGLNAMAHSILDSVTNLQAEKTWKTEFMTMATENLRNPVKAIMTAITELKKTVSGAGETQKYIEEISKQSKQLNGLQENLISIIALKGGEQKPLDQSYDLMEVIVILAREQEQYLQERGLTMTIETRSNHIMARGDKTKMHLILQNLVENAITFTETGGITIRADDRKDMIHVSVIDTGKGIEEKMVHHLFETFHQGATATPLTNEQRSAGLGLYYAKLAIESQGGEIAIHSKPGQGTEIALTIKKG